MKLGDLVEALLDLRHEHGDDVDVVISIDNSDEDLLIHSPVDAVQVEEDPSTLDSFVRISGSTAD